MQSQPTSSLNFNFIIINKGFCLQILHSLTNISTRTDLPTWCLLDGFLLSRVFTLFFYLIFETSPWPEVQRQTKVCSDFFFLWMKVTGKDRANFLFIWLSEQDEIFIESSKTCALQAQYAKIIFDGRYKLQIQAANCYYFFLSVFYKI